MQEMRFLPVDESVVTRWTRLERFDFLHRLRTAPVADTELLHLSHYCPIIIMLAEEGPRVAALLDPAMLQSNPVGKDGRWLRPYAPIALRNLPFWPGARRAGIEVAPELVGASADDGFPVRDREGRASEQYAAVVTWIERLQQGMRRLSEAAKLLIAADVLAPLGRLQPGMLNAEETGYFTVSPDRLNALAADRAAALSADRCLPLDLAAACLFSRRLLARSVSLIAREPTSSGAPRENYSEFVEPLDLHVRLDSSPLFSFEIFESRAAAGDSRTDAHADA
ncbi:SapC family protein [Terrarubrum flagellatum]|uniref:SapC family protein n=1 Tax=Terrirubrum flagellatum TaxID=2895980 RepID=UPI0031450DDC